MVRPIGPWFPRDAAPTASRAPAVLADGAIPAVLLPVRVETRWFEVGSPTEIELRVRIFPDELHVPDDDTPTAQERSLAIACWQARQLDPSSDVAAAAWQSLVASTRPGRASWLMRLFTPSATVPPTYPPLPPPGQTGAVHGLPDRWFIVGRRAERAVFTATTSPVRAALIATPRPDDHPSPADRPALGAQLDWVTAFADAVAAGMATTIRVARADASSLDDLIVVGLGAVPSPDVNRLEHLLAAHGRAGDLAVLADDAATNHTSAARPPAPNVDVGGAVPTDGSGLAALCDALGVPREAARDATRDEHRRDAGARAMATLLWPTTWGQFLTTMVAAPSASIDAVHRLYLDEVRPAGAWPALRIRHQPYGVLAATAVSRWPAAMPGGPLAGLLDELRRRWQALIATAPRLGLAGDLDHELVEVLRRGPRSFRWAARTSYGREPAAVMLHDRTGADLVRVYQGIDRAQGTARASLDLISARTPVRGPLADLVHDSAPMRIDLPPVAPPDADRSRPLATNYLAALAEPTLTTAAVRTHAVAGANPRSLLYLLARHALLDAWTTSADRVLSRAGRPLRGTVWERVDAAGLDAGRDDRLASLRAALRELATRPIAELERAMAGFLDAASHRLDAWVAALATQRLRALRAARPRGALIGGWAWLERPRPGSSSRPSSDGFVHAPSLAQARTAAVLRAAFDAHQADQLSPSLALDLTADRVRAARTILDELRAGASLGHSLGVWIEAWLTDHDQGGRIGALRAAVATPTPGVDPRTVTLDGVRAFRRWNQPNPPDGVDPRLIAALRDRLDAVADLLLADGIHHAVHGDGVRAGVALDALERGDGPIPEPGFDRAFADGPHRRWRVILSLADANGWVGTTSCARALAAPRLDGWAARVIGRPHDRGLTVRGGDGRERRVDLAEIGLCALDVALTVATTGLDGLAQLAAARVDPSLAPATAAVTDEGDELSLIAGAVGGVVRAARPLAAGDLGRGSTTTGAAGATAAIIAAIQSADRVAAAALVGSPHLATDDEARATAMATLVTRAATDPRGVALGADVAVPAQALGARATPTDADGTFATWLADLSRVRPHLDPLELLALTTPTAIGGQRWRTEDGVELVVVGTGGLADELVILDDWTEVAPATTAVTGVALPYDAPRSQPPQALLVAVAPPNHGWTVDLLVTTIAETMDTSRLRAVDPARFHDQVLPAAYVPDDPAETVAHLDLRAVAVQLAEVLT